MVSVLLGLTFALPPAEAQNGVLQPWERGQAVEAPHDPESMAEWNSGVPQQCAGPSCQSGCYYGGPTGNACHGYRGPTCFRPALLCGRLWFRGDYLLWSTDGFYVPPLVTTSPDTVDPEDAGVLGEDTIILFGDSDLNAGARSGGRFTLGYSWDPCGSTGIEATYLSLGQKTTTFHAESDEDGSPVLARPFYDVVAGEPAAEPVAFPDAWRGGVTVDATTDFEGLEILFRRAVYCDPCWQFDLLLGYRYNQLEDDLRITESPESIGQGSGIAVGTTFDVLDHFQTSNEFNGVEFGVVSNSQYRRWGLEMAMKVSLGSTRSNVLIDGRTVTTTFGGARSRIDAGLLAQETNIGSYSFNEFAMVPELGLTLTYDLTRCLRATFGYTFIYWSNVARPGDQIDLDLNLTQLEGDLVGTPKPAFDFTTTDFWAQGLHFGLDYRF